MQSRMRDAGSTDLSNRLSPKVRVKCARRAWPLAHAWKSSGHWLKAGTERIDKDSCRRASAYFCRPASWIFRGAARGHGQQNVQTLITFVMSFAIPCALFLSIICAPRAALREQTRRLSCWRSSTPFYMPSVSSGPPMENLKARTAPWWPDACISELGRCRLAIARFGFRFASHGDRGDISRHRLHHCYSDNPGNS